MNLYKTHKNTTAFSILTFTLTFSMMVSVFPVYAKENKSAIIETSAETITKEDIEEIVTEVREAKKAEEARLAELAAAEAEKAAKEAEAAAAASYTTSTASTSSASTQSYTVESTASSDPLTPQKGVVYYNGHRETYYSQKVLPGGGLDIPGRHVAEDGTVRDGDGYICVASNDYSKGTVVETSLGTAKVYDSGCASGTVDIYTNW